MNIKKIKQVIKKNKVFLISTHVSPDPDGLCSELAFMLYLKSLEKEVIILNHDPVLSRYDFLPLTRQIKQFDETQNYKFDVAVVLDCGDLYRVGKIREILKGKPVINIDHHITNELFGDFNLVVPQAASTTEVLFDFFKSVKFKITKNIAMLLYVGIMTDTGSFRYDNTTQKTHQIAGELIKFNFSVSEIYKKLYDNIPLYDLRIFAKIVSNFEIVFDGKVICLDLKKKILEKFSEEFDLRDMVFKFLRSIKGAEVIIIFSEYKKDRTKVNFRSSSKVDVSKLASYFGGGGHKKASGCIVRTGLKDAKKMILNEVKKVI